MTKTARNLSLSIVAAAHSTCVAVKWNQENALRVVDDFCREHPDVMFEVHQSLCETIEWMCKTKNNTSHEEMTDRMLNSLVKESEK